MKPTIKVSIGGFAFNFEEDAYNQLNAYLESLKRHFRNNPESTEIIADIEFRISELLRMRQADANGVVTIDNTQEIIGIMGNPKDFDDSEDDESDKKEKEFIFDTPIQKKRLYRDLDNKILGGVCGGIGYYFRIDPIIFRLFFACLILIPPFVSTHYLDSFVVLAITVVVYIILWIVMPGAKTFKQKLSMTGADPSVERIEDRSQPVKPIYRGSAISTFMNTLVNIIAGVFIGITSLTLVAVVVTFVWVLMDDDIVGLTNYLILFGLNTVYFKASLLLVILLPVLGLLFLLIKVIRRVSFTTRTLIWFIAGLAIWGVSLVYLTNKGVKLIHQNQKREEITETVDIETFSDSLYVRLGEEYLNSGSSPSHLMLLYKDDEALGRQVYFLPNIVVEEDSTLTNYRLAIRKVSSGNKEFIAKQNAEKVKLNFTQNDSLIIINPQWYNNEHPWQYEEFYLTIAVPSKKRVIVETPLDRSYKIRREYSDNFHIRFYRHKGD